MAESFALKGATRYLREKHDEKEIVEVLDICKVLALDLSKSKGYLHPRALAAASSHLYLTQKGHSITLENTASSFRISSATLREYLRTQPTTSAPDTAKRILENNSYGSELRDAIRVSRTLGDSLGRLKNNVNPTALAAASVYISSYQSGRDASLNEISRRYGISTSTLRDYVASYEEGLDPMERARRLLKDYTGGEGLGRLYGILDRVGAALQISNSRILAAIAYYVNTIEEQRYVTIEKVARDFNISIPALRSYLEPYLQSISQNYVLFKRGDAYDLESAIKELAPGELDLLNRIYGKFGTNIFELSLLFNMGDIPRGRWQLFVRKISKLGLLDIYKKPLDPKQYCALVKGVSRYLTKPESLQRWV